MGGTNIHNPLHPRLAPSLSYCPRSGVYQLGISASAEILDRMRHTSCGQNRSRRSSTCLDRPELQHADNFLRPLSPSTESPDEAMIVKRGAKYSTAMVISAQPSCSHRQELLSPRASLGSRRNFRTDAHACACACFCRWGSWMLLPIVPIAVSPYAVGDGTAALLDGLQRASSRERRPLMTKSWCGRAIATAKEAPFPPSLVGGWTSKCLGQASRMG